MSSPDPPDGATHFTANDQATQYNAPHGSMTVNNIVTPAAVTWPALVGLPPALASAFQPREPVLEQIEAARGHGTDVVLTHQPAPNRGPVRGRGTGVLAGGGGVGKTQLAAWLFDQALNQHTADLLLWINAGSPEQIITAYAHAATLTAVPGATGDDPETDATALLSWLHTTDRRWLIVLDDITDPQHLTGWWPPHRPTGWTLATTRLQDTTLISAGRRQIDVDVYTPAEALTYLTQRLTQDGHPRLLDDQAPALAATLGHLPLALSHAAAYMIDQQIGCTTYLARYTTTARMTDVMPADADPDGYGRPVTVTLLLALNAADQHTPAGLARPALALTAMLDPAGHPDTLWHTPAVTSYLTHQLRQTRRWWQRLRPTTTTVTADQADQVLRLLHRYGLITHTTDQATAARAVRIHALTARATRDTTTTDPATVTHTAADALLDLWPEHDHNTTDLIDTLRTNTTTLAHLAGDLLWHPDGHPLLYRAGTSLFNAGLHTPAIDYWHRLATDAARILGDQHPDTFTARNNLACSYRQAGRTADAITLQEQVLADRVRVLGDQHPDTLTARANLAASYRQDGRTADAITLQEQVLADRVRVLGGQHPDTLTARANLAASYRQDGRTADAITLQEQVLADAVRVLGDQHPGTLAAAYALRRWQAEA